MREHFGGHFSNNHAITELFNSFAEELSDKKCYFYFGELANGNVLRTIL